MSKKVCYIICAICIVALGILLVCEHKFPGAGAELLGNLL